MNHPSLTLSFPGRNVDGRFGIDADELRRVASIVLHNSSPHPALWSEANFMKRLSKLLPDRACILALFLTTKPRVSSCPFVYFGEGPWMPLTDLLDVVRRAEFSPSFMFFVRDDSVSENDVVTSFANLAGAQFVSWTSRSHYKELVAIACEFSRWWGLKSVIHNEVNLAYLADKLLILIDRLNRCANLSPNIRCTNQMLRTDIAWVGGDVVLANVDYDNLVSNATLENYVDALKRLADTAYAPRALYQDPRSHLVSTQSVFWFTELSQNSIDFDWFSKTRIAFELFGPAVAGRAPNIHFDGVDDVPKNIAETFLASFVEIPAGTYRIGSETGGSRSEPPAERMDVYLQAFRILKRPVTGADWRLFSTTTLSDEIVDSLPVTNLNAFQAMLFASQVERTLRRHALIPESAVVSLPTEQQWEAAARGRESFEYPWGNSFKDGHCNCGLVCGPTPTAPGLFSPAGDSPFGCQDMAGNVREWTCSYGGVFGVDWSRYEDTLKSRNLETLRPADRLVIRGGCYSYEPACVACWMRNTQLAERSDRLTGLRLVIEMRSS